MQPAPPGPYKSIAITLPPRQSDASFDAFRKELAEIVKKKDRAALAGKVVAKGFFWQREDSNDADPKKSSIDNLTAALGLDAPDGSGWQALGNYAADATATPLPEMKGVICSPAMPSFNEEEMEKVAQSTRTDASEWAYPTSNGVELRAKPEAGAPVIEKLGMVMVRILLEETPSGEMAEARGAVRQSWLCGRRPARSDRLRPALLPEGRRRLEDRRLYRRRPRAGLSRQTDAASRQAVKSP
jgi:hypothetical protein